MRHPDDIDTRENRASEPLLATALSGHNSFLFGLQVFFIPYATEARVEQCLLSLADLHQCYVLGQTIWFLKKSASQSLAVARAISMRANITSL